MVFLLLFVGAGFIPARNRLDMHGFSGGDKPRHYGKMEFPDGNELIRLSYGHGPAPSVSAGNACSTEHENTQIHVGPAPRASLTKVRSTNGSLYLDPGYAAQFYFVTLASNGHSRNLQAEIQPAL